MHYPSKFRTIRQIATLVGPTLYECFTNVLLGATPANTTFVQRQLNVFDVGPILYECYTNVLFLGLLGATDSHIPPPQFQRKIILSCSSMTHFIYCVNLSLPSCNLLISYLLFLYSFISVSQSKNVVTMHAPSAHQRHFKNNQMIRE